MDASATASAQLVQLIAEWPEATTALLRTFHQQPGWDKTDTAHHNNAGLFLWGLRKYEAHALAEFAHRAPAHNELDSIAAHEIFYHWNRRSTFRRPVAALTKCIYNLVHERGEKFQRKGEPSKCPAGNPAPTCSQPCATSQTVTPLSSNGDLLAKRADALIASVSQAWTPPSSSPYNALEAWQRGQHLRHSSKASP